MSSLDAPQVLAEVKAIRLVESARFDHNGIDLIVGEMVADLGMTRAMLATTVPREWERIASVIVALLDRYPFKNEPRYSGERIILGAFANELRAYALAAGEPATEADLRAPEVVAGELSHAV